VAGIVGGAGDGALPFADLLRHIVGAILDGTLDLAPSGLELIAELLEPVLGVVAQPHGPTSQVTARALARLRGEQDPGPGTDQGAEEEPLHGGAGIGLDHGHVGHVISGCHGTSPSGYSPASGSSSARTPTVASAPYRMAGAVMCLATS